MGTRANLARWLGFLAASVLAGAVGNACSVTSAPGSIPAFGVDGGSSGGGGSSSSGSGGSSSGGSFTDSGSCVPGDVTTWHPGAYHPASAPSDACPRDGSSDLVADFYAKCLGPQASTTDCGDFETAHPDCYACILSPDTADHYGPVLDHGSFVTANVAGCIELGETGPGGLACAQAVQAVSGCELAACAVNCPVTDPSSLASYDVCTSTADMNGCETFESAASCVSALLDGGAGGGDAGAPRLAECLAPSFKDFYDSVVPAFCSVPAAPAYDAGSGVPPSDAGAD